LQEDDDRATARSSPPCWYSHKLCRAFADEESKPFDDDIQYRNTFFPVDFGDPAGVKGTTRSQLAQDGGQALCGRAVDTFGRRAAARRRPAGSRRPPREGAGTSRTAAVEIP
jgi:hypothetical protein